MIYNHANINTKLVFTTIKFLAISFFLSLQVMQLFAQNMVQESRATQADQYCGQNDQRYTITFPAGGIISGRWGMDLYTDDSSIGTAAVQVRLISPPNGGTVTIGIRPGTEAYQGSGHNGVISNGYSAIFGSFVFVNR